MLDTVWMNKQVTLRDATTCRLFLWVCQIMVEDFPLGTTMTISAEKQVNSLTINDLTCVAWRSKQLFKQFERVRSLAV